MNDPQSITPKAERTRAVKAGLIEKALMGIHLGLVAATKCPEFNLEKSDAQMLADSVAAYAAFKKIKVTPEQEALGDMFLAASQIYPPMLMSIYLRKKAEAEKNSPARPTVVPPVAKPAASVTPIRSSATPGNGAFDPLHIDLPTG